MGIAIYGGAGGGGTPGDAPGGAAGGDLAGTFPNPTVVSVQANAITTAGITNNAVTLAKLATQADQTILGNNSGGAAVPSALSAATVRTVLGLATVATSGSASDLSTGTLPTAATAALTGDVTKSAGSAATTLAAGNAGNLDSGTLLAARMPALTGDITTSAGAVATVIGNGKVTGPMLSQPQAPRPGINSLLAWSEDPSFAGGNKTPAAAFIYLRKIMVPITTVFTNLIVNVITLGNNYSNGQVGLYSSAGTLLGSSAIQASAGTNGFGSVALVTLPLTVVGGQSLTVTGSETAFVWVGVHLGVNSATAVVFAGTSGDINGLNAGCTASTARAGRATGHATNSLATIGNLTPSGFSITSLISAIWFGVT